MATFMDRVKTGFNKGVTAVSANSKAMVEKTRINLSIKASEKERDSFYRQLGVKVYQQLAEEGAVDADEEIMALVESITERIEFAAQQHEEIKRIDEEVKKAVEESAPVAPAYMPPLPAASDACACGHTNAANSKFCSACGGKI